MLNCSVQLNMHFSEPMNLEALLQIINSRVNIDAERSQYVQHFVAVRNAIFTIIKNISELFKKLFGGEELSGSYADNLKVGHPDEFDLIFHLKIPESKYLIVKPSPEMPGHVTIDVSEVLKRIKSQKQRAIVYENLLKWTDSASNCLIIEKIQSWLQGCFTTAIKSLEHRIEVNGIAATLHYKRQGPAHTIYINESVNNSDSKVLKYSIDFVPAILLEGEHSIYNDQGEQWEAIPKPHTRPTLQFRAAYHHEENKLVANKNNLKNVLRLMKKFRDSHQNMSNLKSYYIKSLFLWKNRNKQKQYWNSNLGVILLDLFEELEKSLEAEYLPFYWDKRLNLYEHLKKGNIIKEMLNHVKSVRKTLLKAHPMKNLKASQIKAVLNIFLLKPEVNSFAMKHYRLEKRFKG